jgi:excinuclease ABC subunit A
MLTSKLCIRGARTHNLKITSLTLPRNKLIAITGLSGSGKSSLAFDTICGEGQRRYFESLPAYVRQFLPMMEKPAVEHISGLSPTISIQQKTTAHNPRSTVGTVTEVYDYLRVLFSRAGEPRCPKHGNALTAQTVSQMAEHLLNLPAGTSFLLLAPIIQNKKGEHTQLIDRLRREGYLRIRHNKQIKKLAELPLLERTKSHTIEVVVDRLTQKSDIRSRLIDSLETTLRLGEGIVRVALLDHQTTRDELVFSSIFACPDCKYSAPKLEPRLFSFNNTIGACIDCNGLGVHMPLFSHSAGLPENFFLFFKDQGATSSYGEMQTCNTCQGERLSLAARHVFIGNTSLPQLTQLPLDELQAFFTHLQLSGQRAHIAQDLLKEINNRLSFLMRIGLDYLTLSRPTETLSGGEAQRIRLASQIGSGLMGVIYVLDEPSIGLHARDNTRLLQSLQQLRDLGNTVIVVEHDEETMRYADHLVDIGPGAGIHGGQVIAQGTPQHIMEDPNSLTGAYLSGKRYIAIPKKRIPINPAQVLHLHNITANNLREVSIEIPLGLMTCVTGVSGSGKSSLVNQALYPTVSRYLSVPKSKRNPSDIVGLHHLNKIIVIDQQPIGRTPRSNPASYIDSLDAIRELFAATPEARAKGYLPGRFSFNVKAGRCHACEGLGSVKVEMHFLPNMHVTCEVCQGKQYNQETLAIQYKYKNIYEVLSMTVEEALQFFQAVPPIARKLKTLVDVGLSYITLGQSAITFSGGEAQRIKLAKELARKDTGKTLYILDEPTTGLHFHDIAQLLQVLHILRDQGNTIVIIEHNLEVVKTADWIIDLGPEGGKKGGQVIASGTPEQVAQQPDSYTGQYLKVLLDKPIQPKD